MARTHEFRFVLSGPAVERALGSDTALDELAERLFEAGCDDGTLAKSGNEISIDFGRLDATMARWRSREMKSPSTSAVRVDRSRRPSRRRWLTSARLRML